MEHALLERIYLSINREGEEEEPYLAEEEKKGKVSVTMLVYECLRRAYYIKTIPFDIVDPSGSVRRWIGKKVHETPLLGKDAKTELKLEYEGVVGVIDEYYDGLLLEKKTTRFIPSAPYDHHVKQCEYYKVLLEKNGFPVKAAAIVYIDVKEGVIRPHFVETRSVEEIEKELMEKKRRVLEALKSEDVPPRFISFWDKRSNTLICSYCPFFGLCFGREI
jgi:CRISPR/Cas system-associated exonuclease Cas4 (RecB family)